MNVPLWFAGFFVVAMFASAVNPKALGATIAFCLGLVALYPDYVTAGLLTVLYIPAVLLASFRD